MDILALAEKWHKDQCHKIQVKKEVSKGRLYRMPKTLPADPQLALQALALKTTTLH